PAASGNLEDLLVDHALRLDRTLSLRRVAVVDHDVWDAARVADAREERNVPFPAALENDDPLLVGVDPERLEHKRERQLFRAPFDEQGSPREEELGAIAVELREHPKRFRLGERLGLEERGPMLRMMSHQGELLHPVDAQEDGCM